MSSEERAKTVGQFLQELRQARGLTQEQLAEATAVSLGAVRNWEQGRRLPHFEAAYRLAKTFGITLDELAGRVFDEPPPASKQKPARTKRKGKGA